MTIASTLLAELARHDAAELPAWVFVALPHAVIGLFVFVFGACLGSFANVLIYRMPAGISVISPPSRCPVCGARLSWRENLPVVGWLLLRGRCRACGVRISPQYLLIEVLCGLLLLWFYLIGQAAPIGSAWWPDLLPNWWHLSGPLRTIPALVLHGMLLVGLVVMTKIDARTFMIPMALPLAILISAAILWTIQGLIPVPRTAELLWPIPRVPWPVAGAAFGALLGLATSTLLLWMKVIQPSFADYESFMTAGVPATAAAGVTPLATGPGTAAEPSTGTAAGAEDESSTPAHDGDGPRVEFLFLVPILASVSVGFWMNEAVVPAACAMVMAFLALLIPVLHARNPAAGPEDAPLADYPHARREMWRELLFLTPCVIGMGAGYLLGVTAQRGHEPAAGAIGAFAAAATGYLVGGGLIWALRILFTLVLRREAMGIGDIHLLGAIGAVLGWRDPLFAFLVAIFVALAWTLLVFLVGSRRAVQKGSLPFGPHLAVAAVAIMAFRPSIEAGFHRWIEIWSGGG